MNRVSLIAKVTSALLAFFVLNLAQASTPVWTFTPLTPTRVLMSPNDVATIEYKVTNQSRRTHILSMRRIPGITQITSGARCDNPFTLAYHESCTLSLRVDANQLQSDVLTGPIVCQEGNPLQCYQPSRGDSLNIIRRGVTYTVGGEIFGLIGSVVLENNGNDILIRNIDGPYTFSKSLLSGDTYSVVVISSPPQDTCTVSNPQGVITNSNITDVRVNCSRNAYTVGGTVSGLLSGATVVLSNNDVDLLPVSANGSFTFTRPVAEGADYNVEVHTNPTNETCSVSGGTGVVTGNVSDVQVVCHPNIYTVGGTVTGLASGTSFTLDNNGADTELISSNGQYTFSQRLANGSPYEVTVTAQPLNQECTVSNATGTISGANVTNVNVNCVPHAANLVLSTNEIELSVTGYTEYGVTGTPASGKARVITVTNPSTSTAAVLGLATTNTVSPPTGTTVVSTCGGSLAIGASCTITITPGANSSNSTNDPANTCAEDATAGVTSKITVSSTNAGSQVISYHVFDYGCVYQGGFLYYFDDTPAAGSSILGKVATFPSQAASYVWSETSDSIPGISETSTTSSANPALPVPNPNQLAACNGSTDGNCDSNNIDIYYSSPPFPPITPPDYAVSQCLNLQDFSPTWYLPAMCQQGYGREECGSGTVGNTNYIQNIQRNFFENGYTRNGYNGRYWSSTEVSAAPATQAWVTILGNSTDKNNQLNLDKTGNHLVTCSRDLTQP